MNTKTVKTILFAALFAAMILPAGMQSVYAEHTEEHDGGTGDQGTPAETANGENLTNEALQDIIDSSESKIAHNQAMLASDEELRDHRNESIIAHQAILDGLDAIVNSGGVLTADQIEFYDDTVDEIINLELNNEFLEIKISELYTSIDIHQATLDWAQAELDSRTA